MQGEQINTFTAVEEAGQVLSFPLARHACLVGAFTCLLAFSSFSSPPSIFSLPALREQGDEFNSYLISGHRRKSLGMHTTKAAPAVQLITVRLCRLCRTKTDCLPLSSLNPAVNKIATVSFSGAPELRRSPSVTVLLLLPPPSVLKLCPRPSVLSLALLLSLRGSFFLSLCCHLLLSPTVDQRRFELELSSGARHRSPFLLLRLSWLQWLGALRGGALQLEESSRYAT